MHSNNDGMDPNWRPAPMSLEERLLERQERIHELCVELSRLREQLAEAQRERDIARMALCSSDEGKACRCGQLQDGHKIAQCHNCTVQSQNEPARCNCPQAQPRIDMPFCMICKQMLRAALPEEERHGI